MFARLKQFELSTWSLAIVTLLFTLFQVSWSFRNYRLAQEPDSDDNVYLLDAMQRLDVLDQRGPVQFVQELFTKPAHSPFATAVCLLGLAFGANGFVGPYLVSGILVFVFLLEINRLASNLSVTTRAILLGGVLLIPLTRSMVVELRPDFAVGLFGAMACVRLCRMVLRPGSPNVAEILSCALLQALTLLAKPTYFAHSLIIFGLSIALSLFFRMLIDRRVTDRKWSSLLRQARPCAWSVTGCLVLVLPYYLYGFLDIWHYITINTWGANAKFWRIPGGIRASLEYFLSGPGSDPIGGYLQLFLLIILIVTGYLLVLRRFYEAFEIVVGLLAALSSATIIVLSRIGNPTFNVPSHFLLTFAAVTALGYAVRELRWPSLHVATVLPVLIVGLVQRPDSGYIDRDYLAGNGIANKVISTIESSVSDFSTKPTKLALAGSSQIHYATLEILAHNRHFPLEATGVAAWLDPDTVMANLGNPDFVCVSEPDGLPEIYQKLQVKLLAQFKSDHRFRYVNRFPLARGAIWLFQRDNTVSASEPKAGNE